MFNPDESRQKMFNHYLNLCRVPGFKNHAWQQVKELDNTDLYQGIKDYIVEQMNAQSSKS